ncbi:MAG: hypothetical protein ACE5DQ_01255 [Candidatus Paceibacterota bacterium]
MVDINQVLILSAIAVMTVILAVIGVQLILLLRELRKSIAKINNIVSELEKIGMNVSHGYSEVTGFVTGLTKLFQIAEFVAGRKKKKSGK